MPSANIGFAPTAYTSLTLFAAAIAPNAVGSSTMGVKKSTVATSARLGAMRYTAASSRDAAAVSTLGSTIRGRAPITCPSSTGLSLQAQPAPWLYSVNRIGDTIGDKYQHHGSCVRGHRPAWRPRGRRGMHPGRDADRAQHARRNGGAGTRLRGDKA